MRKHDATTRFGTLVTCWAAFACCTTLNAQFREIGEQTPEPKAVEIDSLTPTRHRFVPPRTAKTTKTVVDEGIKAKAPSPIQEHEIPRAVESVARQGQPTPATKPVRVPSQGFATKQPTPTKAVTVPRPAARTTNPIQAAVPRIATKQSPNVSSPSSVLSTKIVQDSETTPPVVADFDLIPVQESTTTSTPQVATNSSLPKPQTAAPTLIEPYSMFGTDSSRSSKLNPLRFNFVTIGQHSAADVRRLWGEPAKVVEVDGLEKMVYAAPGFRQVDVLTNGNGPDDSRLQVDSILIHLNESRDLQDAIADLNLEDVKSVVVRTDNGEPVGIGFPERGVLLGYAETESQTRTIALEPIRGELFRLRAEANKAFDFTTALADLDTAIELDDFDSRAHWLKSELLFKLGQSDDALASVATAIERSPQPVYKLTRARIHAEQGERLKAVRQTKSVLRDATIPTVVRARAKYQLGNLMASGPEADFEKSLAAHLESIELAASEMKSEDTTTRRAAKTILVDAHLAIAQDIALGNYQRQHEVVPKWLIRGTELAERFIETDGGDESLRLDIFRTSLAAYSVLTGQFDASVAAEDALKEGEALTAKSNDVVFQQYVEDELVEILFYAAKVEHARGRSETALKFAQNATTMIEGRSSSETSVFQSYVAGQLYFMIGSIHAIENQSHKDAVEWYRKADPILNNQDLDAVADRSQFADLFVSMAVTYWEVGEKPKALKLTEAGVELMQDAVQEGKVTVDSLEVPYSNLASMHQQLGNNENARHYSEMMAKVGKEKVPATIKR